MTHRFLFGISILFLTFSGCKYDPLDVDASQAKVSIDFVNMDSILFNTPTAQLPQVYDHLYSSIQEIFEYQLGYCLRIGNVKDTAFANSIVTYRNDKNIQQLEKEIEKAFPSSTLQTYKMDLLNAFKYLKTHLPKAKQPKHIVFQNSLFNSSAFCTENEIGIGLEQYLGPNSPTVKSLPSEPFYDWMKKSWNEEYLERDAILSWVLTHVVPEVKGNLAETIIHYGKAIYLTEACLPDLPKNTIIRYSKQDLKWAEENELSFWKYLVDQKMLFKTDERNTANFIDEGPFTPGLPEKGPDRLGQYLGWKIVKNYMEKSKTSFEDLINTPFNEILQSYEP